MKSMKIKNVMKFLNVKSALKFTTVTNARTAHSTKNKAPTKTFKTNERKRVYMKGYCRKIAELKKQFGDDNLVAVKKIARAAGKALLRERGFSICGGDIQTVI